MEASQIQVKDKSKQAVKGVVTVPTEQVTWASSNCNFLVLEVWFTNFVSLLWKELSFFKIDYFANFICCRYLRIVDLMICVVHNACLRCLARKHFNYNSFLLFMKDNKDDSLNFRFFACWMSRAEKSVPCIYGKSGMYLMLTCFGDHYNWSYCSFNFVIFWNPFRIKLSSIYLMCSGWVLLPNHRNPLLYDFNLFWHDSNLL